MARSVLVFACVHATTSTVARHRRRGCRARSPNWDAVATAGDARSVATNDMAKTPT